MAGLMDQDMTWADAVTPADGFTMNAALRYLPYRSFPLFLGQLDELRQAREKYRHKQYVVPFDLNIPIEAFGTLHYQQPIRPGTYIYGWQFAAIDGVITDYTVQVRDTCSGYKFFEAEGTLATALRPSGPAGVIDLYPVLIEPFEVKPPPQRLTGLVDVWITNNASADQRCQFVLHCAEPCGRSGDWAKTLPTDLPIAGGGEQGQAGGAR
jgi:hypothetical protein